MGAGPRNTRRGAGQGSLAPEIPGVCTALLLEQLPPTHGVAPGREVRVLVLEAQHVGLIAGIVSEGGRYHRHGHIRSRRRLICRTKEIPEQPGCGIWLASLWRLELIANQLTAKSSQCPLGTRSSPGRGSAHEHGAGYPYSAATSALDPGARTCVAGSRRD